MNCDPIARWYRFAEYLAFGGALQRRRIAFLNEVADARRALVLGDGDGRFTVEFLARNADVEIDSVDVSAGMLALAKRRTRERNLMGPRLRLWERDARTMDFPATYDLIATHFFLDCFRDGEMDGLISRVSACASPKAQWLISEFGLPAGGLQRIGARVLIWTMYKIFRVTTGLRAKRLPDYSASLVRHGFGLVRRSTTMGGLLVSELWERILDETL